MVVRYEWVKRILVKMFLIEIWWDKDADQENHCSIFNFVNPCAGRVWSTTNRTCINVSFLYDRCFYSPEPHLLSGNMLSKRQLGNFLLLFMHNNILECFMVSVALLYFSVNMCGFMHLYYDDFRTASTLLFRSLACGQLQSFFHWLRTSCVQLA